MYDGSTFCNLQNYMGFLLFIAIASTVYFLNWKFSSAIRIIAFGENEPKGEAIASFILMWVVIISWTLYFSLV